MNKKALSVSLVIPVYNDERYLKACLQAVAAQTVKPAEVIVVDNNSTDDSMAVARQFPFVRTLDEKRQGVVFARDMGFNAATSDIIGRIDSDTILPADWVERVVEFYKDPGHHNHGFTGGGSAINLPFPRIQGWLQGNLAFRVNRLLLGHYILFGSNMAIPRSMWLNLKDKVCHNTSVHEDLDLAIHAHRAGYEITYHESLRVRGIARRLLSERNKLLPNLMMWPATLQHHGIKTWVFGWLGAVILYCFSPLAPILDFLRRAIGRRSN